MSRTDLRPCDVPWGWMLGAACARDEYRDLPWITDSHLVAPRDVLAMARVCAGCPMREVCKVYVAQARVSGGFWAGADRNPSAVRRDACAAERAAEVAV